MEDIFCRGVWQRRAARRRAPGPYHAFLVEDGQQNKNY
jgi:hypothetical protein